MTFGNIRNTLNTNNDIWVMFEEIRKHYGLSTKTETLRLVFKQHLKNCKDGQGV